MKNNQSKVSAQQADASKKKAVIKKLVQAQLARFKGGAAGCANGGMDGENPQFFSCSVHPECNV